MYGIFTYIYHKFWRQMYPFMQVNLPVPWILWVFVAAVVKVVKDKNSPQKATNGGIRVTWINGSFSGGKTPKQVEYDGFVVFYEGVGL